MTTENKPAEQAIGARLSVMMFLEFFVWGGWYVTVSNYMEAHGLASHIGMAFSLCPIAAIVSPFFLGMVADRFFATEKVLSVLHLVGGLALLAVPFVGAGSPTLFLAVLGVHALCYTPTLGLTNALAFHHVKDAQKQFPMIRVFGTIGWIVAGIIISKVLHGDTKDIQFYVAGAAAIILGIYSLTLPHTPAPSAGQKATVHDILGLDTLALLKKPAFFTFLFSSFLICIPLAFYYAFAAVFVKHVGFTDPAFTMGLGQWLEIFFMLIMPLCFAHLGVKWMLLVGMGAWVARYGLFAMAAGSASPVMWAVLIGIALHGVCYDFFFVTGQIYVDRAANAKIRGQAQGFLVLVTQGVGMLIGAQIAGMLFNANTTKVADQVQTQWVPVWLIPCIAAGAIMLFFGVLFRENGKKKELEAA